MVIVEDMLILLAIEVMSHRESLIIRVQELHSHVMTVFVNKLKTPTFLEIKLLAFRNLAKFGVALRSK